MMNRDEILRTPASVEEMELRGIKGSAESFIKGAVYQFIADQTEKTNGEIRFCIRDLLGGTNADWENTPYSRRENKRRSLCSNRQRCRLAAERSAMQRSALYL